MFESRHSDLRVKRDMRTKQGGQLFEFTQERLSALFCAYGERRDNEEQAKQFRVCRHVSTQKSGS